MISATSRYADSSTVPVTGPDGQPRTILAWTPRVRTTIVYTLTRMAGRRVDELAASAYGDSTLWWKIAQANPEILSWIDVPPETIVRVPNAG